MSKYKFWSEDLGIDVRSPHIVADCLLPSSYAYRLVTDYLYKNGVTTRHLDDGIKVHFIDMYTMQSYTRKITVTLELYDQIVEMYEQLDK